MCRPRCAICTSISSRLEKEAGTRRIREMGLGGEWPPTALARQSRDDHVHPKQRLWIYGCLARRSTKIQANGQCQSQFGNGAHRAGASESTEVPECRDC